MRISDWTSDVCSSDLHQPGARRLACTQRREQARQAEPFEDFVIDVRFEPRLAARPDDRRRILHPGPHRVGDPEVGQILALVEGHRSEEHPSELQSLMRTPYAVFCLKKKNNTNIT